MRGGGFPELGGSPPQDLVVMPMVLLEHGATTFN